MLYIVRGENFLLDYYFDNFNVEGVEQVIWRNGSPQKRLSAKLQRILDYRLERKPKLGCGYFEDSFIEKLQSIGSEDRVLFYSVQNLRSLTLMSRLVSGKRMAWLWDSLLTLKGKRVEYAKRYVSEVRALGIEQYTFDPQDAKDFGLIALPQVYPAPRIDVDIEPKSDIYFVGYEKGRIEQIAELAEEFESLGLTTDIRVRAERDSPTDHRFQRFYTQATLNYHSNSKMTYEDSMVALLQSRAVLDIVQSGQVGMTLRAVEAMFLSRKVITTSSSVKSEPFYHQSRVFVLGEDSMEELVDFIRCDFEPIDSEILSRYELIEWINNFR